MKTTIFCVTGLMFLAGTVLAVSSSLLPLVTSDEASQQILADIRNNLESVGAITASVDCQSNTIGLSFQDGAIAMKDDSKMRFVKGSSGELFIRNNQAYNFTSPAFPGHQAIGLRWDDSIENAYNAWGQLNGLLDLRVVLGIGENHPTGFDEVPGRVWINGVGCRLIRAAHIRIHVDALNPHRVIRIEVDYQSTPPSIAYRTDFLQWQSCPGGEYPREIRCSHYQQLKHQDAIEFEYFLSELESQAVLDDSLFELLWMPVDTSTLPPPGTP